ncbi:MAG: hypothetical protein R3C99_07620 [Pirellulaceae bacterium]|nr:hypothetical protein [Planctomycetales bacterium]
MSDYPENPYSTPASFGDDDGKYSPQFAGGPQHDRSSSVLVMGLISMILGILGAPFVLCCGCIGIPVHLIAAGLGIAAVVMARSDLHGIAIGIRDPRGESNTRLGFWFAVTGLVFAVLELLASVGFVAFGIAANGFEGEF